MATATAELTRVVGGETVPNPGTYTLDKTHTVVAFVARHLMVTKVRGTFRRVRGHHRRRRGSNRVERPGDYPDRQRDDGRGPARRTPAFG